MDNTADTLQQLRAADEEVRRQSVQSLRGKPLSESYPLLFLAMADDNWRVRKEAVEVFVSAEPDNSLICELLELFRSDENAGLRNSAAEAIIRLGERASEPLIRLAEDSDADVRKFVIDTMGAIGSHRFFPTLLATITDPDVNVAASAAEQLGDFGDSAAIQELIKALVTNRSLLFRYSVLAALGKLSGHVLVPDEIIALAGEDILRKGVYECLGSIGDESACRILMDGFLSPRKSHRSAAVVSWYRIYTRATNGVRHELESELRQLAYSEVVAKLIELFPSAEVHLSEALTVLFGIIGDLRAVPSLLRSCADERFSAKALSSLKLLGGAGLDALIVLYPQVDEASRAAICTLLGEQLFRAGSGVILEGVRDPSPTVSLAAVTAAARLGLTECITAIAGLLAGADQETRVVVSAALRVLSGLDRNAVREVACQLAESALSADRREAAILHSALGNGELLFMLAKDEDPSVRKTAISGLGMLMLVEYSGLVKVALADEAPDVRIAAADALGSFGSHDQLDALIAALSDDDVWVQSAVLRNIERIDSSRLFILLETLFDHADGILMLTCLDLLEKIGTPAALALVAKALTHLDADIVAVAVAILDRQGNKGTA